MKFPHIFKVLLAVTVLLDGGCALIEQDAPKKPSQTGLITTPPSYYSTTKAKYLGTKYKENLDRLVEQIVRNPKTANLHFANNISSVGGIGFFTHSATQTPDERYLEVVLATPETFETKGTHSEKVFRLFSLYGSELLAILSGDSEIYQDRELNGYGLNLAWRNVNAEPNGNRVTMERAIVYFSKERVRNFLRHELTQNEFLGNAIIFAVEEDGPLQLVSYRPPEPRPDFRPAIREVNLASPSVAKNKAKASPPPTPSEQAVERLEPHLDIAGAAAPVNEALARDSQVELKKEPEIAPVKPPTALAKEEVSAATSPPKERTALPVVSEAGPTAATTSPMATTKASDTTIGPTSAAMANNNDRAEIPSVLKKSQLPSGATDQNISNMRTEARREPVQSSAPIPAADLRKSEVKIQPAKELPKSLQPVIAGKIAADSLTKDPSTEIDPAVVSAVSAPPVNAAETSRTLESSAPSTTTTIVETRPREVKPVVEKRAPVTVGIPADGNTAETALAPAQTGKLSPSARPNGEENPAVEPSAVKVEPSIADTKPAGPNVTPMARYNSDAKPAGEQMALLKNNPSKIVPEKIPSVRQAPRALEGFIIQLAFNDKAKAQRWADSMERRGYAVSVTEAEAQGALRVRLGNFALRDDAERQLRTLKLEGLNGIIINLPQAFRPETRASAP
jgi:DedD protein